MTARIVLGVVCMAACVLPTASTLAHPFHVSIADARWNADTCRLEVAMRLDPADLEQALRQRTAIPVNLDQSHRVDGLIQDYLQTAFVVKDRAGGRCRLAWVGKEVSPKEIWLYFEVPLPDGIEGNSFSNGLLFELLPDQINTLNFRVRRQRKSLSFTADRPDQVLRLKGLEPGR